MRRSHVQSASTGAVVADFGWLMVHAMRMEQINTLSTIRDGENRVTTELSFLEN